MERAAMPRAPEVAVQEPDLFLSSLSPSPGQKRVALGFVIGLLVLFVLVVAGPLSRVPAMRVDAFVPAYATALFVCDSLTAVLLFAQFSIVRSRALLVIANGYLFTALMQVPWILVFPGVFVPGTGLLGGQQSTSWVYFLQHAGFPLFVAGYALDKGARPGDRLPQRSLGAQIGGSIALTATLVCALAFSCIHGQALLPQVTTDAVHLGPLWPYIGVPVAMLSICALAALRGRPRRSMLDLWLMVVMLLYAVEIPLSYYPNPARFSISWYAVRVIGIISGSLVLIVLLREINALYGRSLAAVLAQRREREARLMTGGTIAANIAHEIKQPLTAIVTNAGSGLRFLDRGTPDIARAKEALASIASDGHRAADIIEGIRRTYRSEAGKRAPLDLGELVRETIELERGELKEHGIAVSVQESGNLPRISGDRVQLQQVLLNLVANAIEAMAPRQDPKVLRVELAAADGGDIMVTIADTGPGVRLEDSGRIFMPLFTTKPQGMGMGLAICRAIIEAHGGLLWHVPHAPNGAAFQFVLHPER